MAGKRGINYGRFMERAMRGVVADVLGHVAKHGLSGDHHFYINFDTTHPGVDIPAYLREHYPRDMTIVLQDWFEDLAVTGDRFRVTLNFSNRPETLVIPLEAVKTFVDPSVKFGLKFDDHDEDDEGAEAARFAPVAEDEVDADGDGDGGPDHPGGTPSADVVSLDRFRKR
ncbi:ClpXP protease specificity-enhancing factor SspB [Limibaculum sp. FT325]|uniref:SspB family protein n=1 Tax=Thermohalobaculum sediminis TaxID=2939436 RepID=UPI0020C0956D|nr:ClpXP protease specificity-enhancing factor SspB [Limibaculum sediminis]MCL5776762.1 ClpXP protease specificity-enhancing factor SspB [Limibaculum sediminis]